MGRLKIGMGKMAVQEVNAGSTLLASK